MESRVLQRDDRSEGTLPAPIPRDSHPRRDVPIQFKSSGCLFSIVASIVLTVVLNLVLRSCS